MKPRTVLIVPAFLMGLGLGMLNAANADDPRYSSIVGGLILIVGVAAFVYTAIKAMKE